MSKDDIIFAFFPCVRFEDQIILHFKGNGYQYKNYTDVQKLENCIKLHRELNELYELISKLAIVVLQKELKIIIENPKGGHHYLTRYWCLEPKVTDKNRTLNGDYFNKPTQYWFINCEPIQNMLFEAFEYKAGIYGTISETKLPPNTDRKVIRSMISPVYANRFIRTYILPREDIKEN